MLPETTTTTDSSLPRAAAISPMAIAALAQILLPEELQAKYESRYQSWAKSLSPRDEVQEYHLGQAVVGSIRVENCQAVERHRRIVLVDIANDTGPSWVQDRIFETQRLSESLKRNPPRVRAELMRTPWGRAWLTGEFDRLLLAVPGDGRSYWCDALTEETLNLLGTPKPNREGIARQLIFQDSSATRAFLLEQLENLKAQQVFDQAETVVLRDLHVHGLGLDTDLSLTQLRRSESNAQRQVARSLKILEKAQTEVTKVAPAPSVPPTKTIPSSPPPPPPPPAPVLAKPVVPKKPNLAAEPEVSLVPEPPASVLNRRCRRMLLAHERHQTKRAHALA